ncbi:MAG: pyruvate dehydrogenase component [Pseudonocardiales bacterium]|nr:pyruvate dehydrogenase component [Pseudonocardiales bacterium]
MLWIVDRNRQSLDRLVPVARDRQCEQLFAAAGWHVCEVRYGRRSTREDRAALREAQSTWLDTVPDDKYRALLGQGGGALPSPIRERAPAAAAQVLADVPLAALGMDFRILKTPVRRRG